MTLDYDTLREQRLETVNDQYRQMIAGFPRLGEVGVEGVRSFIAGLGGPMAPGVATRDVDIPGPNGSVPARIYTPEDVQGPLGVVLHVHSGGFVANGGLDAMQAVSSALAVAVPCVVVSPDFRLPPEHKYPAGLQDCWAVLTWIASHGHEQGWDGDRLAVGGGCTGGNFAAVLALMARDAGGPDLKLQFLQSWVADARCDTASQAEFAVGYGLEYEDNRWVVGQYLESAEQRWDWQVSPLLAESVAGVAPALITVGEWDILRDEDVQYANRLRDAGVEVTVDVTPREGHVPNPENREAGDELLVSSLRRALGG